MELELTALALVSIGIKLLVDILRRAIPALDASGVNLVAFGLGYAATYISEVGDFTSWVGRANAAISIAGASHIVAEVVKTMRARQLEALTVEPIIVDPE